MKKLFAIILTAAMLITSISVGVMAETVTVKSEKGMTLELDLDLLSDFYIAEGMSFADCYWVLIDDGLYPVTTGDVDSDGSIDGMDCVWLMQYVAGWDLSEYTLEEWGREFSLEAADVTRDGKVNLADVSLLMKYEAGWFERGITGGNENQNLLTQWMNYCRENTKPETPTLSYFDWLEARK